MATAAELRRLREEQSIFAPLYEAARQQQSELAAQGRRPVFGGLLSKEPVYGTDTLRYEGIGNMLAGLLSPAAKAVDAPISAMRGTIPQEDMISEALGVGGLAMAGGGAVGVPRGAVGANAVRNIKDKYPDVEIDIYGDADRGYELGRIQVPKDQQSSGVGSQVMNDLIAAADAEGAKISLTPDTSFGGTSVSRLKDFYKRFGFVENKGRNKDFSTRNTMYRDPTAMANASKSTGLLTSSAADLRRQANIERFGYDPNETPEASGFDAYLRRVNPSDKRIPEENRPNLMMGDMYGMLPRDAEYVSNIGSADIYRTPDGSYYATAYNPDLDEMDVVGYAIKGDKETDLQVVSEMQGKGIGGELQYLFRKENPDAPTGGLTEAGEASLLKTYSKLRDDGVVAANASKSAGLLTTAASEAQDMAKRILELRAEGRASEVTDEMMAQADPQYMFANTPLPMDEASRMARAEAAGFEGDVSYHGTKAANLDRFNPEFMKEGLGGKVIYSTDTPKIASGYAGSDMPYDPTPVGSGVLPLLLRGNRKAMPASDLAKGENLYFENVRNNIQAAKDEGFSGMDLQTTDPTGAKVQTTFDAPDVRSRFARFDPEFAHLSNLSAANASPIGGLLAQSGANQQSGPVAPNLIDEYLKSLQARR